MIALLHPACNLRHKAGIIDVIQQAGLRARIEEHHEGERIGIPGASESLAEALEQLPGVRGILHQKASYGLVSRFASEAPNHPRVGAIHFGGPELVIISGPCAVESEEQILLAAQMARAAGVQMLRGGAFKPRTSPYSFQGLGPAGLELLAQAGESVGLPVVTEVVDPGDVELVARYADMLQIGARNMQNFSLLRAVGELGKPVLLKRGMMSTLKEFLLAAEYIVAGGNSEVVLCERGIRSFDSATRNIFDVTAIPLLKQETHLPVIADPSHACGIRSLVPHISRAAIAAGADGLIVEMHPAPEQALSDGAQSLTPSGLNELMRSLPAVAGAVGRRISP